MPPSLIAQNQQSIWLSRTFLPAATYNSLPELPDRPDQLALNLQDLEDLGVLDVLRDIDNLLLKYRVTTDVRVHRIHRHADISEGQVMVYKTVQLPQFKSLEILEPTSDLDNQKVFPRNYFVNEVGAIQPYEYSDVRFSYPPSPKFGNFLADFRDIIVSRGLQHQIGLKIDCSQRASTWGKDIEPDSRKDFEFPEERSGFTFRDKDFELSLTLGWSGFPWQKRYHFHTKCVYCKNRHPGSDPGLQIGVMEQTTSFEGCGVNTRTPFLHPLTKSFKHVYQIFSKLVR